MSRKIKILCTVGPSTLDSISLHRLEQEKVDLLRINLSHTPLDQIEHVIKTIQSNTTTPICIDSEGAQLRTGSLKQGSIMWQNGEVIRIHPNSNYNSARDIHLNHDDAVKNIDVGEIIHVDFNHALIHVIQREEDVLVCRVLVGGEIASNKGLHLQSGKIFLEALTCKDKEAIRISKKYGIRHFALSFANSGADVEVARQCLGDDFFLISKIETNGGLTHLEAICKGSDAVLIDRGDLSREQPIQKIPFWQKKIVSTAKKYGVEIYVATNLLESMVQNKAPTRAEISDIANTLLEGVDGLVLAAETAIGKYPILCARTVRNVIREFEKYCTDREPSMKDDDALSVASVLSGEESKRLETQKRIDLTEEQYTDFLHLVHGTYNPLATYLSREELENVLEKSCLPGGIFWPEPVLLQIPGEVFDSLDLGERLALFFKGSPVGGILVKEKCGIDFSVSGVLTRTSNARFNPAAHEMTPAETRLIFRTKGWRNIGACFSELSNPENLGKILLQKQIDGVFVSDTETFQPRVGQELLGDDRIVWGSFRNYPRYSILRDAIFRMLCLKNYGCTHVVIDHAAVERFSEEEMQTFLDQLQHLEIQVLIGTNQ